MPATLEQLWHRPWLFVARRAFAACTPNPRDPQCSPPRARIICISDTHSLHSSLPPLPAGDVLIHAGDLTATGSASELRSALAWLAAAPHPHKILVAGNHDSAFALPATRHALLARFPSLTYLEDSSVLLDVRGRPLSVYGSPRTPRRGLGSFHYPVGAGVWPIPPFTDILVTHGPPACHLDGSRRVGCPQLLHALWRVRPRLHVFGHIHAGRGVRLLNWSRAQHAYERVCLGRRSRWPTALGLVAVALATKLAGRARFRGAEDTVVVNAASLGGVRNDLLRSAIVVDIELPEPWHPEG